MKGGHGGRKGEMKMEKKERWGWRRDGKLREKVGGFTLN